MEFSPNGKFLLARYYKSDESDPQICGYNTESGKQCVEIGLAHSRKGSSQTGPTGAITPNGKALIYGQGSSIRFCAIPPVKQSDIEAPKIAFPSILNKPELQSTSLCCDKSGTNIYWIRNTGDAFSVNKWDMDHPQRQSTELCAGGGESVPAHSINLAVGVFVAAVQETQSSAYLECWTLGKSPMKHRIKQKLPATCVGITGNTKMAYSGHADGSVVGYDLVTYKQVGEPFHLTNKAVKYVACHPSGRYLAVATTDQDAKLSILDVDTGVVLTKFQSDQRGISTICFDSTGERLAVFGESGTIKIYDARPLLKLQKE